MAMTKIDRVEDLPEWFNLENYEECAHFGARRWASNLEARANILDCFKTFEKYRIPVEMYPKEMDWLPPVIAELQATPIKAGLNEWQRPVRALIYDDIAFKCLDEKDKELAEHWRKLTRSTFEASSDFLYSDVGQITTLFDTGFPIMVDLRATDSVLIEAFAIWLKENRTERAASSTSKRERPAYKDWARYGLLPYLDLLIWTKETDSQIPHHVMAEAVGYCKGGDSFRKTVPKLAAELMNSLGALVALAGIEEEPE
jgi:hypothetical protein